MYLTNDVLLWKPKMSDSFNHGDNFKNKRAYEILVHAETILASAASDLHLVDCIANLKRAINHRLKTLNEIYNFNLMFKDRKPSRLLEQLALLDIVKPMMLEKLILIRNELEHEDKIPPTRERILEFAELTWYFLKSTDNLVSYIANGFNIVPTDKALAKYYWLNLEGDLRPSNNLDLSGWVKPAYISNKALPNWLQLIEPELETRSQMLKRLSPNNFELKFDKEHGGRGKNSNDLFLKAKLRLPDHIFLNVCRLYFSSGI